MVNKGLEFTLNAKILESENGLNWSLGGNISTLKNEVTKMYDENDIITGRRIIRKGEAVNSFYLKKWAGANPENGNPRWYINGEGGETTKDYDKAGYALQ